VRAFGQSPTNYALERTVDEGGEPARPSTGWKFAGAT